MCTAWNCIILKCEGKHFIEGSWDRQSFSFHQSTQLTTTFFADNTLDSGSRAACGRLRSPSRLTMI